jgi:iron complex transport system permease protein
VRQFLLLIGFGALACVCLIAAPLIGTKITAIGAVIHPNANDIESSIFWSLRLPRVLTAFLAGSTLAISGMVFQAMFRNPLATESTLGVASGASFGAALQVRLGWTFMILGISAASLLAFVGAALSMLLVYGLTRVKKGFSTSAMLLAGVAISFLFSSLILMVQSTSDFRNSYKLLRWLMGGLCGAGYDGLISLIPFAVIGTAIIAYFTNELNLLSTGDDIAASRGVEVGRVRTALFFATSLTVGGVVSICGPIGFVGMIAPHISRLIIGHDHRYLMPTTALFGGVFLTICDTVARMITAPAEMPVGAITALLGGPFFIWLLVGSSGKRRLI